MDTLDRIREIMQEKGLSQVQLADKSGLAKGTLSRILNGKQELKPNTIEKIANALEVSFYDVAESLDDDSARFQVAGYIDYCGDIVRIKSLKDLKKQVADIEHLQSLFKVKQTKLPKQKPIQLSDIDFTHWETIDATKTEVKSFKSGVDIVDGDTFDIGNMCSGYPFYLNGEKFLNSEAAYIAGMFCRDTKQHIEIQRKLQANDDGYAAKKQIRMRNQNIAVPKESWEKYNVEWMKYVVWSKCKTNEDFAKKLMAVPETAMIVENSTGMTGATAQFWGCFNKPLSELREAKEKKYKMENPKAKKEDLNVEKNKWTNYGVWEGVDCMGKILKACSLCLIHGTELPVDYSKLNKAKIHLFGKLLKFPE